MKKLTQMHVFAHIFKFALLSVLMLISASIFVGCSPIHSTEGEKIAESEQLIWSNFTKADSIANQINTFGLSSNDFARFQRLQLELKMWENKSMSSEDSITAQQLIQYFKEEKDYESLCKTYFIIGRAYYYTLQTYDAITYLKEGEYLLDYLPDSSMYAYLIKYTLGNTSEYEQLFSVAHNYYKEALPYAKKIDNPYLLRACYLDIARTPIKTMTQEERNAYFDSAQYYANLKNDTIHALEVKIQHAIHNQPVDSTKLIALCHRAIDTLNLESYSIILLEYYAYHNLDTAQYYLNISAKDTTRSPWNISQYHYLESLINFQKGEKDLAYRQLERIYRGIYDKIQEDGHTRSYAIARQMDWEKEKQKSLELTIQHQKNWLVFSVILIALLFVIIALVIIVNSYKQKNRKAKQENEKLITDINHRMEILRETLSWDVKLLRYYAQLPIEDKKKLPDSIHEFLHTNMLDTIEEQKQFLAHINKSFNGIIDQWKESFPNLTTADLLYLALVALGLKTEDIGFLLNMSAQSIWNRRQRIKTHTNGVIANLEEWRFVFDTD